jgi:flagellar basal body-associated protein FliL
MDEKNNEKMAEKTDDKKNDEIIKPVSGKASLVVIIVALLVLVVGAFGIWWYSGQAEDQQTLKPTKARLV